MSKLFSRLKLVLQFIYTSIGFFPTLISLLFFGLAVLMIYFETRGISNYLKDDLPFFIITHGETANMILSTIASGIFSLIVFSFTMVMLVLNQASSNFSPRVIPGLISSKSNQKVLGLYLGTLIYTLVVMVNVRSEHYDADLPGLAVFLAMCFTILCLAFFVYFIHSISASIQIDNILEGIYNTTLAKLHKEIELDEGAKLPAIFETGNWLDLESRHTGYLQHVDRKSVISLCQQHNVVLEFLQPLGNFVIKGLPFARVTNTLKDKDSFCENLDVLLHYYQEELAEINYLYGFKQITESAVKALSPSVNDPGTAIKAIDYLTDLFIVRMGLTDEKIYHDDEGTLRLRLDEVSFEELMGACLGPLRVYGKEDPVILLRLLNLFQSLCYGVAKHPKYKDILYNEASHILQDANATIKNPGDRGKLNAMAKALNTTDALPRKLALLTP
ncbi:DUF2254 domain-containing protein [Pontibacter sp. JH31]|uniref:DUF2254 domain-containing protein n=1 Tax=Pontibacter aquaedesilientis TaxID=2766980 RepID=A0ABR7XFK0_9BACT|nr:DUF2254 domain-containing protein [Pontibacter aquaedesilientis]MBD1396176.1 DUF2254 domain-containing protein [Pontibacter aquaedesilientis]